MSLYEKSDIVKWRLWQFVSANGRFSITDWRKSLPVGQPKADMDVFLRNQVKFNKWEPPIFAPLHGKAWKGLTELRWKSCGVQHRILGYILRDHEYAMLIGCTHKQSYDPPEALYTLLERKKSLEKGEARLDEYKLIADC